MVFRSTRPLSGHRGSNPGLNLGKVPRYRYAMTAKSNHVISVADGSRHDLNLRRLCFCDSEKE